VTGGASGIGKAIAERLSKDGYRVAVFDLNPGGAPHSYTVDVTDRAQIDAALKTIHEELGPVTILVNAAGLDGFRPFLKISFEQWEKVVNVNLHGVFHMVQAMLPDMIEAGWGRIVNISSSSTHSGTPYMTHYVSAKSGVNGLTKSLALEFGPDGITVNAVPPGFIDTPMLRKAEERGNLGDIEKTIAATPVRRIGKPEDIAATCSFLISEEAATSPASSSASTAAATLTAPADQKPATMTPLQSAAAWRTPRPPGTRRVVPGARLVDRFELQHHGLRTVPRAFEDLGLGVHRDDLRAAHRLGGQSPVCLHALRVFDVLVMMT